MESTLLYTLAGLITLFLTILLPVYWKTYGPQNFLWLSDIGLFLTFFGLWLQSPLLISIAVITCLPLELIWCVDYFLQLFTRRNRLGIVEYMFDTKLSLFVRGLSLFHIVLPIIWVVCLFLWGYDNRALLYATLMVWIIFGATYLLTDPKENINWVFFPSAHNWKALSPLVWLLIMMGGFPILILWPMHALVNFFTE